MGNRAKELRELRGLSVQKAAELIGTKRDTLYKLERGQRTMTEDWQRRLARVYEVPARDIVSDGGFSIEIKHSCFRALNARVINVESAPKKSSTSASRYLEAPGFVMRPSECFGFRIADDHASHLFPSGASGVARPIDKIRRPLRRGEWVIVRHFKRTRRSGDVLETVVGQLDFTVSGDLILLFKTDNRDYGAAITLRAGKRGEPAVAGDTLDYTPSDDDPAEILGVVIAASVPVGFSDA